MSGKRNKLACGLAALSFCLTLAAATAPLQGSTAAPGHAAASPEYAATGFTVAAFREMPGNPIQSVQPEQTDAAPEAAPAPSAEPGASPGAMSNATERQDEGGTQAVADSEARTPLPPGIIVPLKDAGLRFFGSSVPVWEQTFPAKYREGRFPLSKAVNLRMVERFTGPLSKERRKFLQDNRFLLIPQEECKASGLSMLELFTEIGKEQFYKNTTIPNALFVGPDPFLHALHGYLSTRLQYLEQTRLSLRLIAMLEGLYDNAGKLRKLSGAEGAASFERLQAQFLVPLTMLASAIPSGGGGLTEYEQMLLWQRAEEGTSPLPATLDGALAILKTYESDLSPDNTAAVRRELQMIFAAEATASPSPLFSRHYAKPGGDQDPDRLRGPAVVDYTRFTPRGHYEKLAVLRAYFRAMLWLGEMSWNMASPEGTADALNFALIMSMTPERPEGDKAPRRAPAEDWREIMELTAFFTGYPSEACYAEWVPYLRQAAGVERFDQHTASDPHVLARIQAGLDALKPSSPYFTVMQRPRQQSALRVFPPRFSVPWLITDELSKRSDPERRDLPQLSSSLWIPAVMGSPYALELLEPQTAASLKPQSVGTPLSAAMPQSVAPLSSAMVDEPSQPPAAPVADTPEASRAETGPAAAGEESQAQSSPVDTPAPDEDTPETRAVVAMRVGIQRLALLFREETPESWSSSLNASWLRLLHTLTPDYGKDMPLYMQSPMFRAKQLETFLGSYVELKHDTLLYENFDINTTAGPQGRVDVFHPIPNGFVEPNLPFWHGMIGMVDNMAAVLAAHNLLEIDRREGGALHSFKQQLLLCAALAEKELKGQKLSRKEYDSLREQIQLLPVVRRVPGMPVAGKDDGEEVIADLHSTDAHNLYGATGRPYVMLVLVGNEQAPRLTVGVAYNHTEFVTDRGKRLSDSVWREWLDNSQADGVPPLPPKPFWYNGLEGK